MAVDGHHWPSAGVRRGMTGGVASSVREKREGGLLGRPVRVGPSRKGEREGEQVRGWAVSVRASIWAEREEDKGSRPTLKFCFLFQKWVIITVFVYFFMKFLDLQNY
jgi:hypothetical protein